MKSQIQPAVIKQFMDSRIHHQQMNVIHPPYHYEQQLLHAIQQGDFTLAKSLLGQINQLEGATLAKQPTRSKKNALIALCTLFTRSIIEGGVLAETAFHLSDACILEIEKASTLEQLNQLENSMLELFVDTLMKERAEIHYSYVVRKAISYIHQNILQDLSLEPIAQHVMIHPSYLSSKFKKEVGLPLTEFINKKRIEESTYFLQHTTTSISDISFLFKFCNQSYYTALFKKHIGMTPKEYRHVTQASI
ncbi:AraC family transcriptional regulator [Caldalkalibacillus mannanilyticus]|uniref:AraC family transcriptional regulator n=1 Tax=Caldalkalibacillus mannanilyticus TaxID=1418 RepID=UPI000469C78E|nr:AraC family transcriptional regulator [Caldalkalibacillus mannanilyticus]